MDGKQRFCNSIRFPFEFMNERPESVMEIAKAASKHLLDDVLSRMVENKSYVIRRSHRIEDDIMAYQQKYTSEIQIYEVPEESVYLHREYKLVEVDDLEIEAINCKNCAAPIPVGRLDLDGHALVRCSYCGTYHNIKAKEGA